jgi:hypothetical protein
MEHPTYSSDLPPNDFWLFPKQSLHLRDKDFKKMKTYKKM